MTEVNKEIVNEIDTPEEVEVEKDKMAGIRKIVVAAVVLLVGSLVAHFKGDIPPNMLQLLEVLFGGFIVGNVTEHVVGSVKAVAELKHAPAEPVAIPAPVTALIDEELHAKLATLEGDLAKALGQQAASLDLIQQTLLTIIQKAGLDK